MFRWALKYPGGHNRLKDEEPWRAMVLRVAAPWWMPQLASPAAGRDACSWH